MRLTDPTEEALARRVRALACTKPLHELEANKPRITKYDFSAYTMGDLAFRAIDLIAVNMGFARGLAQDDVVEALLPHCVAQAPERSRQEHRAVAEWILDELIGTSESIIGSEEDGYLARAFSFALITEHADEEGRIYLRATDAAINVLVGALDIDIESAQHAAEARLRNLIDRGLLPEAEQVAHDNRLLAIKYMETIRRNLDATQRNLAEVDWKGEVSPRLDEAEEHVRDRVRIEGQMIESLGAATEDAEDPAQRVRAHRAAVTLRHTQRTHAELLTQICKARPVLFEELERQRFRDLPGALQFIDLKRDALVPLLAHPIRDAVALATLSLSRLLGAYVPRATSIGGLVERLLAMPRPPRDYGEPLGPLEYEELESIQFSDVDRDAVRRLVSSLGTEPRLLSELIADAAKVSDRAATLAAFVGLRTFGGDAIRGELIGPERVHLASYPAGAELDVEAGEVFRGDDLWLLALEAGESQ